MEFELRGRTAVVGGATSGLGRASAAALAAEGCNLVIWSRRTDALAATARELASSHGVTVDHVAADAADPEAAAIIAEAAMGFAPIDILVLNAGGPPTVDPTGTDAEGWNRSLQLLAATPIALATRLLPGMRERGWGRVVAILSSGVRQPINDLVYSNAGRSALAAWLKTTARAIAAEGVTLNGVLPGASPRRAFMNLTPAAPSARAAPRMRSAPHTSAPSRPGATGVPRSWEPSSHSSPRSAPPISPAR